MDNLLAHKHPTVIHTILNAGHRFAFRAPYNPTDGPIEYVFDTIENALKLRLYEIYSHLDLQIAVYQIINSIPDFVSYFTNVGFN